MFGFALCRCAIPSHRTLSFGSQSKGQMPESTRYRGIGALTERHWQGIQTNQILSKWDI